MTELIGGHYIVSHVDMPLTQFFAEIKFQYHFEKVITPNNYDKYCLQIMMNNENVFSQFFDHVDHKIDELVDIEKIFHECSPILEGILFA